MALQEKSPLERSAIADGVCDAFLTVLDGVGHYPMTRDDILDAIATGVERAVADHLIRHPLSGNGS